MELLISGIRRLQVILLKVSLLLGVQVYAKCGFLNLVEPTDGKYIQLFFLFLTLWPPLCLTSAMFVNQTFFSSKNPSPSSLIVFIEC